MDVMDVMEVDPRVQRVSEERREFMRLVQPGVRFRWVDVDALDLDCCRELM